MIMCYYDYGVIESMFSNNLSKKFIKDRVSENYIIEIKRKVTSTNLIMKEKAQKGADVFLTWLFSSATGKKLVSTKLNFITPFNTFSDAELPADPLSKEVSKWMNKDGVSSVVWTFNAIPSEIWKDNFGSAMLQYFGGKLDWDAVEKTAIDGWAAEKALVK
mgnify:CR=1 FL=1